LTGGGGVCGGCLQAYDQELPFHAGPLANPKAHHGGGVTHWYRTPIFCHEYPASHPGARGTPMGFCTHSALEVTGATSAPLSVASNVSEIAVFIRFI
jgi:hypothetical protein